MEALPAIVDAAADYCVLCRSPLVVRADVVKNREVIAVIGTDRYIGRTVCFALPTDKGLRQRVLVHWMFHEPAELILRQCPWKKCSHRRHQCLAICFHKDCHNLLKHNLEVLPGQSEGLTMQDIWKYGKSTMRLSMPNSKELKRRNAFLISTASLTSVLSPTANKSDTTFTEPGTSSSTIKLYYLFFGLPPELQRLILVHSWRHPFFSPLMVQQSRVHIQYMRRRTQDQIKPIALGTSNTFFLGSITFENSSYVSYISDKSLSLNEDSVCHESAIFRLRLSLDDTGIRNIEFLGKRTQSALHQRDALTSASLWYKIIQIHDQTAIREIQGVSDGLFIRDVHVGQKPLIDPGFTEVVEWDTPEPPTIDLNHYYRSLSPTNYAAPMRMRWIPLRLGLKGIVAAYNSDGLLALHAWYNNTDAEKIYTDQTQDAQWIFVPMGAAERVLEVWIRQRPLEQSPSPAIKIRTTYGKSYTIGPYVAASSYGRYSLIPLQDPGSIVSGLYCNATGFEHSTIQDIGVTCDPDNHQQLSHPLPMYHSIPECLDGLSNMEWSFSCASLKNLESIHTCRDMSEEDRRCIGFLFYYLDGSCQGVGQWRWDLGIDSIMLENGSSALIRYRENESKTRSLAVEIEASDESVSMYDDTWESHSLQGQIIWWFSASEAYIVYPPRFQRGLMEQVDYARSS